MAEVLRHRTPSQATWAMLVKVIAAAALIYLWFLLWRIVLLFVVAIVIAVALNPIVTWLERRRWPRWLAAGLLTLLIAGALVGFLTVTWTSLADQARTLSGQAHSFQKQLTEWVPSPIVEAMTRSGGATMSWVARY